MAVRAEKSNDRSNRIVKQLEAMKKNWKVRLEKLSADQKKDDLLSWELLGIDGCSYDEAHLHKNLYRFTKMTRVAGLPLTNSERAFDLFLKTRYTMQLHRACAARRGVRDGDAGGQHHGRDPHHDALPAAQHGWRSSGCSSSTPGPPPSARASRRWRSRRTAAATGCTRASRASSTCPS
jgi:hypothetical protein